jgi:hypothetical protein
MCIPSQLKSRNYYVWLVATASIVHQSQQVDKTRSVLRKVRTLHSLFNLRLGLQVSDTRNEEWVRQFLVALERDGVEEQIECEAVA